MFWSQKWGAESHIGSLVHMYVCHTSFSEGTYAGVAEAAICLVNELEE